MPLLRLFLAALLLAIAPAAYSASAFCPDTLIGDSLAVGLAPSASRSGFTVFAKGGVGLAWLKKLPARCAGQLVIVLGTNDVAAIRTEQAAQDYAQAVAEHLRAWQTEQAVWVLPGCFDARRYPRLEAGSRLLDGVAKGGALPGVMVLRPRVIACHPPKGDGIHLNRAGYQEMWGWIR